MKLNRDQRIPFEIDHGMSERYAFESRIIWECQQHLNCVLTQQLEMLKTFTEKVPSDFVTQFRFHLAILLVLSFPSLTTNLTRISEGTQPDHLSLCLYVQPLLTPEIVTLSITFCNDFESIKIKLTASHSYNRILAIQKDNRLSTGSIAEGQVIWKPTSESAERACINWSEWFSAYEGRMNSWKTRTDKSQIRQYPAPLYGINNGTENIQETRLSHSSFAFELPFSVYSSVVTNDTFPILI